MTDQQKHWVAIYLENFKCSRFHHGDCVGADSEAHDIAAKSGYPIVIHPPSYNSKRAFCEKISTAQVLSPKWYIDRNHDIVDSSEIVLAAPGESTEQLRSGTWATIRYAKKKGKPLIIVFPDGSSKTLNMKIVNAS
jgi:acetylornithine deacetylase/succinyl-diaminopimelate desuccinylase-like protein